MTLNMMLDNAVPEAIAGALTQQHPGLFFTMVEQASVGVVAQIRELSRSLVI